MPDDVDNRMTMWDFYITCNQLITADKQNLSAKMLSDNMVRCDQIKSYFFFSWKLKGIVSISWDFNGIFMILSYSLDDKLPLDILFFNFMFSYLNLSFCLKLYHVWQTYSRGIVWKKCVIYPKCAMFSGKNSATKSGV
jgi:hypothetical protein